MSELPEPLPDGEEPIDGELFPAGTPLPDTAFVRETQIEQAFVLEMQSLLRQEVMCYLETGRCATEYKRRVGHGRFMKTLEKYFPKLGYRNISRRMLVHQKTHGHPRLRDFAQNYFWKMLTIIENTDDEELAALAADNGKVKLSEAEHLSSRELLRRYQKLEARLEQADREIADERVKELESENRAMFEENKRLQDRLHTQSGGLPDDAWLADWSEELFKLISKVERHVSALDERLPEVYDAIPCRIALQSKIGGFLDLAVDVSRRAQNRVVMALKLRDDGLPDELPEAPPAKRPRK